CPEAEGGEGVAEAGRLDVRWRRAADRVEKPAEPSDALVEGRVGLRVAGADVAAEPEADGGGLLGVAEEGDRAAVRQRSEDPHVRRDEREPVTLKVEVLLH